MEKPHNESRNVPPKRRKGKKFEKKRFLKNPSRKISPKNPGCGKPKPPGGKHMEREVCKEPKGLRKTPMERRGHLL